MVATFGSLLFFFSKINKKYKIKKKKKNYIEKKKKLNDNDLVSVMDIWRLKMRENWIFDVVAQMAIASALTVGVIGLLVCFVA